MKTIKINKSYSNGSKILYVIVPDICSDTIIEEYVETECDKDLSGHSNGYSMDWDVETDVDVISGIVNNKLRNIDIQILKMKHNQIDLLDYLNDINISKLDINQL